MSLAKYPQGDQIRTLLEGSDDTPVVMLNLLSFKDRAKSSDGSHDDESGEAAYQRYAAKMIKLVTSKGGRLIWSGRVDSMVIGESAEAFQMVALLEYPNRAAFVDITGSVEVAEIGKDRAAGLDGQWLFATTTL